MITASDSSHMLDDLHPDNTTDQDPWFKRERLYILLLWLAIIIVLGGGCLTAFGFLRYHIEEAYTEDTFEAMFFTSTSKEGALQNETESYSTRNTLLAIVILKPSWLFTNKQLVKLYSSYMSVSAVQRVPPRSADDLNSSERPEGSRHSHSRPAVPWHKQERKVIAVLMLILLPISTTILIILVVQHSHDGPRKPPEVFTTENMTIEVTEISSTNMSTQITLNDTINYNLTNFTDSV